MKNLTRAILRAILMVVVIAVTCGGAFAGTAAARTFVHKQTKMKVTLPGSWKVEAPGGSLAGAKTPDGKVAVLFMTLRAKDLPAATKQLEQRLRGLVHGAKLSRRAGKVNGMTASFFDGVGKAGSQPAQVGAVLVETKRPGVWLMGFALGKKADYGPTRGAVDGIYRSIAPAG